MIYNRDMGNIELKKLENIKDELNSLGEDDVLFVDDESETRYVIMPVSFYDKIEDIANMLENGFGAQVSTIGPENVELTYEEYENIKTQIIEAFDKSFKPKPGKMN